MQFSKLFSIVAVALLVSVGFAGVVAVPAAADKTPELSATAKRVMFRDDDVTPCHWKLSER